MNDDSRFLLELQRRHAAGETLDYVLFWGHQRPRNGVSASCFSQWYEAPFVVDGERFATAEHFMMAAKARLFGSEDLRAQILRNDKPGAAKALGRCIEGFDDALWRTHRFDIVVRANQAKFGQHPDLREFLVGTGTQTLVEASPVDPVWGIGLAKDHPDACNPTAWQGSNLLGFALMEVRATLVTG